MARNFIAALVMGLGLATSALAQQNGDLMPDGLHFQGWFSETTGDVRTDLAAAAAADKDLMYLFEQRGCIYCAKMHKENFGHPEIVAMMTGNFLVVQMDMRGSDTFTGFDGIESTEEKVARDWGVTSTPTTLVLRAADPANIGFKDAELFRLPGYLESFQFYSVLDYFITGAFEYVGIRPYMVTKAAEFSERGIDPRTW